MIVILRRGDDCRVLRGIHSISTRELVGGGKTTLFQPRCMFTADYLSTYDAIVAVGPGAGRDLIHWIKEPRYD